MNRLECWIALLWLAVPGVLRADVPLGLNTTVIFATADTGRELLTTRDEFVERLSPFDRAARLKTSDTVSEARYLEFVGNSVLEWTADERQRVLAELRAIGPRIATLAASLPKVILMIKTTGAEEGGAPYTRANAVVLPQALLASPAEKLRATISHELFHVLSRTNPELRDRLYAVIGFEPCRELEIPVELRSRKITNPDAPRNQHCIRLEAAGKQEWAIPILLANSETYDRERGGQFFDYLELWFLVVERRGNGAAVMPVYEAARPKLLQFREVSRFFEQVGRNTNYIIHPEEILADNFALLVTGQRAPKSPRIAGDLEAILKEASLATPDTPATTADPD